jgi:hypothetical protein
VEGGIPQLVNSIPLIQCNHLLFLDILAHVYVANAALLFNPIFHVSVSGECGSLRLLKERKLVSALVSHVHWVCLACAVWY